MTSTSRSHTWRGIFITLVGAGERNWKNSRVLRQFLKGLRIRCQKKWVTWIGCYILKFLTCTSVCAGRTQRRGRSSLPCVGHLEHMASRAAAWVAGAGVGLSLAVPGGARGDDVPPPRHIVGKARRWDRMVHNNSILSPKLVQLANEW
jgi:hypothetical protein